MLAKLRAADSQPGVLDVIGETEYFLFGGYEEDQLRGDPGAIVARRGGAICRATVDGAVWIPQLRRRREPGGPATFKLPATLALGGSAADVPEALAPLAVTPGRRTYQEISYRESAGVGYLEFSFPGGAMSSGQCRRLLAAYRYAQRRPVRVIVLGGPRDVFSNGIHLNVIEAAGDPAAESWRNINAINDLVEAILTTTGQLTVAALAGNAAAGGLMLALAADEVWCRSGAVLNPHYRLMGLHGSEYWTYTLPRRVGEDQAARLTDACLPVSPASALRMWPGRPGDRGRRGRASARRWPSWPGARLPPGLPAAGGREGRAADRGRHGAAAPRLPAGRARHHEPELLRPARAVRPAAPRLCLQAEADADTAPPRPPPDRRPPPPCPAAPAGYPGHRQHMLTDLAVVSIS